MLKRILFLCLAAFGAVLLAAGEPISVDEANPPFMFAKDGKAVGIYPAIASAAFTKMGPGATVQAVPWKKAIQDLDDAKAGVIGIYKNAEREKKYDFSDQIFMERIMVYFQKGHPIPFTKVPDLKGKKIGVLKGWSYGDEFDAARKAGVLTVEEANADAQNMEKLDQGHLDGVLIIAEAGAALQKHYPNVAYSPTPLLQNPTYLAFNKKAAKGDVLKQFNEAILALKKGGDFQRIVQGAIASALSQ